MVVLAAAVLGAHTCDVGCAGLVTGCVFVGGCRMSVLVVPVLAAATSWWC